MFISRNARRLSVSLLLIGVTLPLGLPAQDTAAPLSDNILSQIELALSGAETNATVMPDEVEQSVVAVEPDVIDLEQDVVAIDQTAALLEPLTLEEQKLLTETEPRTTAELLEKLGVSVFEEQVDDLAPAAAPIATVAPAAIAPVARPLPNPAVVPVDDVHDQDIPAILTAASEITPAVPEADTPHVGELLPDPTTFRSACAQDLALLSQRVQVYFGPGSTKLSAGARDNALMVARLAADCPSVRINVLGFTDPVGDEEVNIRVSQARAKSVVDMIAEYGFDTSRFNAISHTKNHGPECKHFDVVDRRVAFQVIEGFS